MTDAYHFKITPELGTVVKDVPCCDPAHLDGSSRRNCPNVKCLLLYKDTGAFALVHPLGGISFRHNIHPPTDGSLELLRRSKAHEVKGKAVQAVTVSEDCMEKKALLPHLRKKQALDADSKADSTLTSRGALQDGHATSPQHTAATSMTAASGPLVPGSFPLEATSAKYSISKTPMKEVANTCPATKTNRESKKASTGAATVLVTDDKAKEAGVELQLGAPKTHAAAKKGNGSPDGKNDEEDDWEMVEGAPVEDDYVTIRKWF